MPTKRNYLVKVMDAKIVDVKRALEAKGIKIESIYEMYKESKEPEKVVASSPGAASEKAAAPAGSDAKDASSGPASPSGGNP